MFNKNKSKTKKTLSKELLLKSELNYFKGLSIFITVLIVCVFFAFGTLFCAMYTETKLLRMNIEFILGELTTPNNVYANDTLVPDDQLQPTEPEWLTFSKYGLTVKFPGTWTFLDKPYDSQVHFYSDRKFREEGSDEVGDFYIYITKSKRTFAEVPWVMEPVTVVGLEGERYSATIDGQSKSIFVLPFGQRFVELHFTSPATNAVMEKVVTLLKIEE